MALDDFAGFGMKGYRSFGSETEIVRFGPISKVHLIVGRNNVGKSNVLHFMHDTLATLRTTSGQTEIGTLYPGRLDVPDGWSDEPRALSLCLSLTPEVRASLTMANPTVSEWLASEPYSRGDAGVVWLDLEFVANLSNPPQGELRLSEAQVRAAEQSGSAFSSGHLQSISSSLTSGSSSDNRANLANILRSWSPWQWIPPVKWVDAVRELTAVGAGSYRNGRGLIADLAKLQNPGFANLAQDTAQFDALQRFLKDVLDDPSARIQIPQDMDTIHVYSRGGGVKPLEHVGTGISEVIFIAAVASTTSGHLICIEEPELHLHPTLQRKLIDYLYRETDNHYLISTHSAQMLNSDIASISHIEMVDGISKSAPVISSMELSRAVSDLGNRASDLVQSNFVVWVEGPSDRLYIRHWISTCAPDLTEGAHYSIMFYGGALLNHLTAEDEELDDFIKLLRINRNLAVVIDSDRTSSSDTLNATKTRVLSELSTIGALGWVTSGYTIENYVPSNVLREVMDETYPGKGYSFPSGMYRSPLAKRFVGLTSTPSKVTIARKIVEKSLSFESWPQHVQEKTRDLVRQIRAASGLSSV